MRTPLVLVGTALAAALLPSPAQAAPPSTSRLDAASAVFGSDGGGATVDGFSWSGPDGSGRHGAVEVFAAGLECSQEQPAFAFEVDRLERARLSGTQPLTCWDGTAVVEASVTADVRWTAAGPATTTRSVSPRTRCRTKRTVVPVRVTGRVVVAVAGRAPLVLEHVPSAHDALRAEVTRCAVRGEG